jgi:hypothetical protein
MEVTGAGSEEQGKKIAQLEAQISSLSTAMGEIKVSLAQVGESQNG